MNCRQIIRSVVPSRGRFMESSHAEFQPGMRLSRADVLVLVVGSIAVAMVSPLVPWLGFAIGFVVAHFFLFCNVFHISRALELAWAALFLAMTAATLLWGSPGWLVTAASCSERRSRSWLWKCASRRITASAGNESTRGCASGGKPTRSGAFLIDQSECPKSGLDAGS